MPPPPVRPTGGFVFALARPLSAGTPAPRWHPLRRRGLDSHLWSLLSSARWTECLARPARRWRRYNRHAAAFDMGVQFAHLSQKFFHVLLNQGSVHEHLISSFLSFLPLDATLASTPRFSAGRNYRSGCARYAEKCGGRHQSRFVVPRRAPRPPTLSPLRAPAKRRARVGQAVLLDQ